MENYVKLSVLRLNENEMKQIIGGDGEGNGEQQQQQQQGPPPLVRYGVVIPMYGVVAPKE